MNNNLVEEPYPSIASITSDINNSISEATCITSRIYNILYGSTNTAQVSEQEGNNDCIYTKLTACIKNIVSLNSLLSTIENRLKEH